MIDKKRNMIAVCQLLGLELGEVFSIDGNEKRELWRITAEHGLEIFNSNPCLRGTSGRDWGKVQVGDVDFDMLLLEDYTIRKFPNSPLRHLGYHEPYEGKDYWGEEL